MNLNLNFNGKTLLRDWWKSVLSNFTTINSEFELHRTSSSLAHPDKSVKQQHIADKAVGTAQIADKAVGSAQISDFSIGPSQLAQYAVSGAKIYPAAVQTPHIQDGNITKAKLETSIQNQLDDFQEHIDNPSKEILDGSVTLDKLDDNLVPIIRNFMTDTATYTYCANNFTRAFAHALFFSFNSKLGAFKDAPPDTTVWRDGYVHYVMLVTKVNVDDRLQIALNIGSMKKFVRVTDGSYATDWSEM